MTGRSATRLEPAVVSFGRFLRAANRSPKTVDIYTGAVRKLRGWLDEHAPDLTSWDELRSEHLNGFLSGVLEDGKSAAYASNLYRALQQFIKWAISEEEITGNPMAGTAPPRASPYAPLSRSNVSIVCHGDYDRPTR